MNAERQTRNLVTFFLLTFIVSFPIWILAVLTKDMVPSGLPVNNLGFLAVLAPISGASILSYREGGFDSVKELVRSAFDYEKISHKIWFGQVLFTFPVIYLAFYGGLNLMGGQNQEISLSFPLVLVLFLLFILFAFFEEAGWQGYAFDSMEQRWNTLKASIILGTICVIWHLPLYVLQNPPGGLFWIAGQGFNIVITRVLIVLINNKTGKSVFSAILLHAVSNLCTMILPLNPFISTIVSALMVTFARSSNGVT
jgi:membrane protease YdiL (CAAX protease family)